jgi:hypothetical protein
MSAPETEQKHSVATAMFWGAVTALTLFGLWAAVLLPLISARPLLLPAGAIALIVATVMVVVYTRAARR